MNTNPQTTEPLGIFEIGEFLHFRGEFEDSIPFLERALILAEPLQDIDLTWNILRNLAAATDSVGQYEEALYYYREVFAIDRERKDKKSQTKHLIKMGEVYIHSGDLVKGAEFAQDALTILKTGIEPILSEKEQMEIYFSEFIQTFIDQVSLEKSPRFLLPLQK